LQFDRLSALAVTVEDGKVGLGDKDREIEPEQAGSVVVVVLVVVKVVDVVVLVVVVEVVVEDVVVLVVVEVVVEDVVVLVVVEVVVVAQFGAVEQSGSLQSIFPSQSLSTPSLQTSDGLLVLQAQEEPS
jgi:hypothetical protein